MHLKLSLSTLLAVAVLCVVSMSASALQGDTDRGQQLVATCAACHGETGIAAIPTYPNLASQSEKYLIKQLELIQNGGRPVPLMTGQLDGLNSQDFADIAAFYTNQEPYKGFVAKEHYDRGIRLYMGGNTAGVPVCAACHAPDGAGLSATGYPLLSGQQPEYVMARLEEYANLENLADGDLRVIMRDIARRLTSADRKAVAHYIRGLRKTQTTENQ